jgi:hypothetical protein
VVIFLACSVVTFNTIKKKNVLLMGFGSLGDRFVFIDIIKFLGK